MVEKILNFIKTLTWRKALLVVIAGGAYFFLMLDTTPADDVENNIQTLTNEVGNLRAKVKEARDFEQQYEDRKKRFVDRVKALQAKQGTLPKQFFLPDLLSDLLKEAKQLEIEIVSIQPDTKEEQQELYSSLGFNLELRGTFVQVFIFLDRMAHMKRIADVRNFSVALDPERGSVTLGGEEGAFASSKLGGGKAVYPGVTGKIRVVTYRYRGPEEKAPPGAEAKKGGKT